MAYSESQKRASIKYASNHYKRVPLDLKQDYYNAVKVFLKEKDIPVNTYIKTALSEKLDRDGFVYEPEESRLGGGPLPSASDSEESL